MTALVSQAPLESPPCLGHPSGAGLPVSISERREVFSLQGLSHHSHPIREQFRRRVWGQVHPSVMYLWEGERDDANIWLRASHGPSCRSYPEKPCVAILCPQIEGTKAFRRFCHWSQPRHNSANSTQRITSLLVKIKLRLINPNSQGSMGQKELVKN